jgi:hypothetical protein
MANQSSTSGSFGQQDGSSPIGDYNAIHFVITQMLGKVHTATLVQVKSVTNSGGVSAVGFVDVQPLVNQLDGAGNSVPHGTLHSLPYFRIQGGGNAVILDPQVGDIGVAIFSDRDISTVAAAKSQSNPGSYRRFDMSDGMYLGGFLNGTPTQYVDFSASGITVFSPNLIKLQANDIQLIAPTVEINASGSATITTPTFTVNGATVLNGPLSQGVGAGGGTATMLGPIAVTNNITAGGIDLMTHKHTGVTTGSGTSGGPTG